MLFRYLRSNFLFWFGAIFTLVGLGVFFVIIVLAAGNDPGPPFLATAALTFMGLCFFVPGIILAGKQLRRIRRSIAALERGQYIVGRVEEIVATNETVNGVRLYRVAWTWQGHDGKKRRAQSPSMSKSAASHWKPGDEIAAYLHPTDLEFAEADVYGYRAR